MTVRTPRTQLARRPGFTLVEMLTVIVIMGILAGLGTGAYIAARAAVRRSIIIADIKQLETALTNYKNEVGEFPPRLRLLRRPRHHPSRSSRSRPSRPPPPQGLP